MEQSEITPGTVDAKEESESKRSIRKIWLILVTTFLLVLVLSYIPFFHVISIIEGRLVSTTLNENSLNYKGQEIAFSNAAIDELKQLYLNNQKTEFSVCLQGHTKNNKHVITRVVRPQTWSASVFHVSAEPCDKDTIIALHSHPFKRCIFSSQDIDYYKSFKQRNLEGMIALMCEQNRFTLYRE